VKINKKDKKDKKQGKKLIVKDVDEVLGPHQKVKYNSALLEIEHGTHYGQFGSF
jgi:hypothetical protein